MVQYDDVATRYAQLIAPKYEPIAQLVADRIPPDVTGVVVEPAIGTGLLTGLALPLLPRCAGYVGVDVSAAMLAVARSRLPDTVTLVEASALEMPIPDAGAGLLLSSLGPVQETVEFLTESVRVLAPGAPLLLVSWGEDYAELDLLQRARQSIGCGSYPTGVRDAVLQRASDAGLAGVSIDTARLPVVHDSVDAYLDYRAAFGRMPWLPEGRDDDWWRAVRDQTARYVDADGRVCLDWTLLVLSAHRPG